MIPDERFHTFVSHATSRSSVGGPSPWMIMDKHYNTLCNAMVPQNRSECSLTRSHDLLVEFSRSFSGKTPVGAPKSTFWNLHGNVLDASMFSLMKARKGFVWANGAGAVGSSVETLFPFFLHSTLGPIPILDCGSTWIFDPFLVV
ncbi:hypothetical protein Tco_1310220 [Tanacetum coccineum]